MGLERRPHRRHRRGWAWAFAFALVLAQGLALAHGVLHARVGGVAGHDLFDGHHAGDAECRLVDQIAHADALPVAPLALPSAPPAAPARASCPVLDGAASIAAYLARAPPRG